MLTSKQRAMLKARAQKENSVLHVGKGGINDNLIIQMTDALRARELVKITVLDTAMLSAEEAAEEIAEKTRSDVVQVIGKKAVFFKRNLKNPKINISTKRKKIT